MDISRAKEILDYWFPKDGSADYNKWFMKSEDYDEEITTKFGDLLVDAEDGLGFGWLASKDSYVAYIILMDQFSRHIYRGHADAFKNDKGVMIFTELGWQLYSEDLVGYEFMFAFMPYMHIENKGYQRKGEVIFDAQTRLYKHGGQRYTDPNQLPPPGQFMMQEKVELTQNQKELKMLESMKTHVEGHQMVIRCYGRFPKRNEILGRTSTFHEEQYMNREEVKNRPY